jgi:hypothetical protein
MVAGRALVEGAAAVPFIFRYANAGHLELYAAKL